MSQLTPSRWLAILFGALVLIGTALACQGNVQNMTVNGLPQYICPSATPRPTDTPLPPVPPTYPAAFQVTLDYPFITPNRTLVNVQYLAQNVGPVSLSYSAIDQNGFSLGGASFTVAYTGNYIGVQGSYPLFLPSTMSYATITVSSNGGQQSFIVYAYSFPYFTNPTPSPCCLPPPLYPPPRPTYTPYPTPTLFEMVAPTPFFLDDPVYNRQPPVELRLRLKSPIKEGQFTFYIPLFGAASWQLEITNVGQVEYDFLGAGYTYVSEMNRNGTLLPGVWPPAHSAAEFLNITEQAYGPQAIQPGQTVTTQVAAWVPVNAHVSKIAMLLNPYQSGDPGWATFTPNSGKQDTIIQWTNAENTICKGEIAYP